MTLTEFRKFNKIKADELSKIIGFSPSYIRNNGYKQIEDLPKNLKCSLELIKNNLELKKQNELLKSLIK